MKAPLFSSATTVRTSNATASSAETSAGRPRSKVMTLSRLNAAIAAGHGQGRDERYLAWIRIRRHLTSRVSNLFVLATPLYATRALQLLSGLEHRAALLSLWLGVHEIREQFPMWPTPHSHPLTGISPERDKVLDSAPGLVEIAQDAGVEHGCYPGTDIPFVATSDFLLRVGEPPMDRLVFWACKPRDLMRHGPRSRRILERLELERRYASSVGATSCIVDGTLFTETKLAENLDWVTPPYSEVRKFGSSPQLEDFAERLDESARLLPLLDAIEGAGRSVGLSIQDAQTFFRMSAWRGLIDIDLSRPILMTCFMNPGGNDLRRQLFDKYLGSPG